MKNAKTEISTGAKAMLPSLEAHLNGVLIETAPVGTSEASPRTRPVRILTDAEMADASHRDIVIDFRDGAPAVPECTPRKSTRYLTRLPLSSQVSVPASAVRSGHGHTADLRSIDSSGKCG